VIREADQFINQRRRPLATFQVTFDSCDRQLTKNEHGATLMGLAGASEGPLCKPIHAREDSLCLRAHPFLER
jgi:hypothetical protein